ncbi:DUF1080 domain-containing protein [Gemmatimonas sp.]|uniref:3-keto-disaccharide hydrolase n=1 Tax=Gemmatimonas sp. TaxID=1962908 RepID=UPI003982F783
MMDSSTLRVSYAVVAALVVSTTTTAAAQANAPVIGRWDLTVQGANGPYPSWVEVSLSGNRTLVGRFVAGGGSARPIAKITYAANTMRFAIPPQWDAANNDMTLEATVANDRLTGTIVTSGGQREAFTARRAPALRRTAPAVWGAPVTLFNGTDLTGWTSFGGTNNWKVVSAILTNTKPGANMMTDTKYTDFRLHLEFRYPKNGNSGVYLRGRHEVQVEDVSDAELNSTHIGGVYGFLVPNENAANGPGVWNTYDITLIGRRVTVVLNGKTVVADQIIPGITGGALDSDEGAPGPIYLQGDHTTVEYRNIVITPVR